MTSIRDLVFNAEYPYRYQTKDEIIFSKYPMIIPSIIERHKMKKFLKNYKKEYYIFRNKYEKLVGDEDE